MNRFLSEIQGKYTELVQIVKISISFNRLVFPMKYMKFNQFSHPMTFLLMSLKLQLIFCHFNNFNNFNTVYKLIESELTVSFKFSTQRKFFLASETAQRQVTEIMEIMETLNQTVEEVRETQNVLRDIDKLSEEWDLFDADVFIVRILMIDFVEQNIKRIV